MRKILSFILIFLVAYGSYIPKIYATNGDLAKRFAELRKVEQFLPDTEFKGRRSKKYSLSDFEGKVVIVNFWATWCPPCVEEMPALDKLQKDLGKRGVEVVAISEDFKGLKVVKKFYKEHKIRSLLPYADIKNAVFNKMKIKALPTSVFFNKKGIEVKRIDGFILWDGSDMRDYIETLINEEE